MKTYKFFGLLTILALLMVAVPIMSVGAASAPLYVDDDGICDGNSPCFLHPQDAVNAANPGDTILVYPGTYDSRNFVCDLVHPTWCAPNDNWAPALIVYKDGLTIKSVEGPANTIIQSTHYFWSNAIAVQNSTAGGIVGVSSWSPNAITIIANNVTIDGFTLHRPFDGTWATKNTAGVFIGSKASGYADFLGHANGATVQNNIFSDVWHAVYIWHSSGNRIVNNTVAALSTDHWAAISTYDGYDDAGINLGNLSENNLIAFNNLANKGIAVGAWAPSKWTSAAGDVVACNTISQVGVTYANGPVLAGGNTGGFWLSNTDKVLNITGISYTGDMGVFPSGTLINLNAQLTYAGSGDGSGVDVMFTLDGTAYTTATTVAGGLASTTATLSVGVYEIGATVEIYPGCTVTSGTQFLVVYDASAGFVTGGGWIDSPAGAYYPSDLPYFEGSYYEIFFSDEQLNFFDARDVATGMTYDSCGSAHLATITSQGEYETVLGLLNEWPGAVLGGYQDEGVYPPDAGWQWVTGEPFEFETTLDWWLPGEPNDCGPGNPDECVPGSEQVLEMYPDGWNDVPFYEPRNLFMVEYEDCDPDITGKATFGFVSKYKKGASIPEGNTEFQFKAGNLNFQSTSYEWLVVTGSNYAKFKGAGTINGQGDYKFQLWAGDNVPDTFRIKIWEEDQYGVETVVYDNGMDQEIGGGSIVVHTK